MFGSHRARLEKLCDIPWKYEYFFKNNKLSNNIDHYLSGVSLPCMSALYVLILDLNLQMSHFTANLQIAGLIQTLSTLSSKSAHLRCMHFLKGDNRVIQALKHPSVKVIYIC